MVKIYASLTQWQSVSYNRIKSLQDNNVEYIVGNLNELYQFRILGDAKTEGSNAVYKVELGGGNTQGVPAERLLSGERFSVEAAFVEDELSRAVGDKYLVIRILCHPIQ